MLHEIRQIALQMAFIVFTLLEVISILGIIASLFVMIWVRVMLGIKVFLSCVILYAIFKSLSDKTERLCDDKD